MLRSFTLKAAIFPKLGSCCSTGGDRAFAEDSETLRLPIRLMYSWESWLIFSLLRLRESPITPFSFRDFLISVSIGAWLLINFTVCSINSNLSKMFIVVSLCSAFAYALFSIKASSRFIWSVVIWWPRLTGDVWAPDICGSFPLSMAFKMSCKV